MNSLDFPTKNISIGSKGRVAGWGLTSFPNGQTSPNLVKINLNVLSPIECDREGMQVTNSQFCAVHPTKEKTICRVSNFNITHYSRIDPLSYRYKN